MPNQGRSTHIPCAPSASSDAPSGSDHTMPDSTGGLSLYERWRVYLDEARAHLGADAPTERLIHRAIATWREREPSELGFVAEQLYAELREAEHETTEDALLDRVERGDLVGLRSVADGTVVYLDPRAYRQLTPSQRDDFESYDPLIARAIRRHAMEQGLPTVHTSST